MANILERIWNGKKDGEVLSNAGMPDKATVLLERDDRFKIDNYINGLRDFILYCNTPMTIAIQGDWGTGKTSIMEMTLHEIDALVENNPGYGTVTTVKFNTWEHSQFNLADQLPFIMVFDLISQLSDTAGLKLKDLSPEEQKKAKSSADNIKNIVALLATFTIGVATRGQVQFGGDLTKLFPNLKKDEKPDLSQLVSKISEIKYMFEAVVNTIAPGEKDKLVIFIDDLDRLDPAKAIEVLEVLKNFLDCEKCVFVLAIDYKVVQRGVKVKYGSDFDEEKAKSFFDKIIQVPFQVPVGNYDLNNFINACASDIGLNLADSTSRFIELAKSSVGRNPRAIKRIFNALLLSKMVADNTEKNKEVFNDRHSIELLFAILCLQQASTKLYDYITVNQDGISAADLETLKSLDLTLINNNLDIDMSKEELDRVGGFIEQLYKLIDPDENGISDTELALFKTILACSAVTGQAKAEGRGSNQVNSIADLEFQYDKDKSTKQFEFVIKIIEEIAVEGHISYINCNSHYVKVTGDFNSRGTSYCTLNELADEVKVYLTVPNKKAFRKLDDDLKEKITGDHPSYTQKERDIIMYISKDDNEEKINDFKRILAFCYEEYRKVKRI